MLTPTPLSPHLRRDLDTVEVAEATLRGAEARLAEAEAEGDEAEVKLQTALAEQARRGYEARAGVPPTRALLGSVHTSFLMNIGLSIAITIFVGWSQPEYFPPAGHSGMRQHSPRKGRRCRIRTATTGQGLTSCRPPC